jgi:hypothetical protein
MGGLSPGSALSGSFFASVKGELSDTQPLAHHGSSPPAIVEYIAWYNVNWLHSASATTHRPNQED